jgi:predicted transcriptional regulator
MATEVELSKRERQIMDVLFQQGEATAADVRARMPEPPSYTAVRTMLRILEEKRFVNHRQEGRRYVYRPCRSTRSEGRSALQRVLRVFFGGSLEQALAAHLSDPNSQPDRDELERLRALLAEPGGTSKGKKVRRAGSKS